MQRKVTGCELASAHTAQRWLDLSAYGLGQRATGAEPAARGRVDRRGSLPEGRVTDLGALDRWDRHRHRLQQLRCVWMTCKLEHGLAVADLDDLAEVHHGDPVGEIAHNRKVVRDEDIRQAMGLLEAAHQVQDLS